jgi:hypothetical protein
MRDQNVRNIDFWQLDILVQKDIEHVTIAADEY